MGDYQPDSALSAPAQEPRQDQQPQVEQKGQPQDEREAPRWVWFLIGPTGCGKTTHAKALAKNLNFTYIEGDNVGFP
ncbi:hypothetical protein B0T17DRAFT_494273 [Bombardia bombarda]|uniref:ATPase AAA-type core domain-containing protein n=1 Tax=Bombardia bombarda TaxID=252184 RepID=A0AA39WUT6_9PEZI|nr:hypothetical protein B0T17DRAFT_494273 [Bombardia bombarda]